MVASMQARQLASRTRGGGPFTNRQPRLTVRAAATSVAPAETYKHTCADGKRLEVVVQRSSKAGTSKPSVIFVHGSYHAAWCYQENFLPYFAERGYDAYAVSLRAQGGSDRVEGASVGGTLDTHAADLASLVATMERPPIMVAHSFGGLILQKYILKMSNPATGSPGLPPIAAAGFLCSVPHTGNKELVMRFLKKDLWLSLKVTWGFIAKTFATDAKACRELFFSSDLPADALARYQQQLAACSPIRMLDLSDVSKQVPLPAPPPHAPPAFVLGGEDDCVVDVPAVEELAGYFGVKPVVLKNMAHDCMLDTRWRDAASSLGSWLDSISGTSR